jgi:hypothetical protein
MGSWISKLKDKETRLRGEPTRCFRQGGQALSPTIYAPLNHSEALEFQCRATPYASLAGCQFMYPVSADAAQVESSKSCFRKPWSGISHVLGMTGTTGSPQ